MATITGNNGVTFVLDESVSYITQIALDLGYYQNDISGEQLINNAIDVTSLEDPTGWTQFLAGKLHNLVTSYIRFPLGGFFDRDNATIWNDSARLDDYDAANPCTYRVDKLTNVILNTFLQAAYQDWIVVFFDTTGLYIDRIQQKEVTEHKDSPNRGSNLIANPSVETNDTGWAVVNTDEITTQGRNTVSPINGIADYKLTVTTIGTGLANPRIRIDYTTTPALIGSQFIVKFKYKVNSGICELYKIRNGAAGSEEFIGTTLTGSGIFYKVITSNDPDDNAQTFIYLQFNGTNLFEVQIDDVEVYKVEANTAIGEYAWSFLNFQNFVGNPFGGLGIHPAIIVSISSIFPFPTYFTKELRDFIVDNKDEYAQEFQGFIYMLENYDWNLIQLIIYNSQRTNAEQTAKLLKWTPVWSDLI